MQQQEEQVQNKAAAQASLQSGARQTEVKEAQRIADARLAKLKGIDSVLEFMARKKVTNGEILQFYSSDARTSREHVQSLFEGLFAVKGRGEQILTHWTSSRNSSTGGSQLGHSVCIRHRSLRGKRSLSKRYAPCGETGGQ